jgi:hypothetical protein
MYQAYFLLGLKLVLGLFLFVNINFLLKLIYFRKVKDYKTNSTVTAFKAMAILSYSLLYSNSGIYLNKLLELIINKIKSNVYDAEAYKYISLIIVISFLLYCVYFIFGILLFKLMTTNKSIIEELENNNVSSVVFLGVIIISLILLSGLSIESFLGYFNIQPLFPSFNGM